MSSEASVTREEATVDSFRRNTGFAIDYLNGALEDGDEREIMLALRRIAQAFPVSGESPP